MFFSQEKEKKILYSIFAVLSVFLFYICYSAQTTFDTGDGLRHYLIARYSWEHPALFLDLWGKPLFTLDSSPFAQFGLIGINVFQIICAILTSYFCYRIAKKINLDSSWLLPIFICFSPIYFAVINTGLTEIFFGCGLMFCIWMLFEKKNLWAAICISFLPFIRAEVYAVLPLIILVLFLRKQWLPLLFLFFGSLIYTIIGFFYYKDFLWIIHQNYSLVQATYSGEKGNFFHYIKHYNEILGVVLSLFLVLGIIGIAHETLALFYKKNTSSKNPFLTDEIILIYGSFFSILFLHTFLYWYKGFSYTNLGMMRYMATLVPAASIICIKGLNYIFFLFKKNNYVKFISIPIAALVTIVPFKQWYFPFRLGDQEKVIQEAGEWYKKSDFKNEKIYYLFPLLPNMLEIDPFDKNKIGELWGLDKEHPENGMEENALVFWDAHYGPNEGEIKLSSLLDNPNFKLLKVFKPGVSFKVLGGYEFAVYVFQKKNNMLAEKKTSEQSGITDIDSLYYGNNELKITDSTEFCESVNKKISEIKNAERTKFIDIQVKIFPATLLQDVYLIAEIRSPQNEQLFWEKKALVGDINKWNLFFATFAINPAYMKKENSLRLYVWNQGKKRFSLKEIKISCKENADDKTSIIW